MAGQKYTAEDRANMDRWLARHCDFYHFDKALRSECPECQEMIAKHGEMPGIWPMIQYANSIDSAARRKKYARKPISEAVRWTVWERDDFRCKHCGSRRFLTVDHIEPVIYGGTNDPSNLQTLCHSCNSKKWAHRPARGRDNDDRR